jgi:hypothetical protein
MQDNSQDSIHTNTQEEGFKLNNYYKDLPEGFAEDYVINAKKKSTAIILNLAALVLTVGVIAICYFLKFDNFDYFENYPYSYGLETFELPLALLSLVAALIIYLILHELTHGLFYKLLTKQKLTFGLTFTVAYCGLKEGYVNKKTAIIAMLAPFVIHSIWMLALIIFLPANIWTLMVVLLFGIHFGGCSGDLYGTLILLIKYRKTNVLVNDDGPKQVFYIKK